MQENTNLRDYMNEKPIQEFRGRYPLDATRILLPISP
jgi:hypothetical protein